MDKEDVTYICMYIHNGILLSHKKEWNNAICSNMDGPRDYHAKWIQRKTNIIWYQLYVKSKKMIQIKNRNRLTDTENQLMVTKGEGGREG